MKFLPTFPDNKYLRDKWWHRLALIILISTFALVSFFSIGLAIVEFQSTFKEEIVLTPEEIDHYQNDLNNPFEIRALGAFKTNILQENSFDAIFVSAALEHVDIVKTIPQLAALLKPGGVFLNLGMKKGAASAVFGMVYKFKEYSPDEIRRICGKSGLTDIQLKKLSTKDFPANLSRVAVIARKPA